MRQARPVYPVFLRLDGEPVLVVGAGAVAAGKLDGLLAAGARITIVSPAIAPACRRPSVSIVERAVVESDLDGVRFVIAAATPEVNRGVAAWARARNLFVNAVDDADTATAYLGGVVRRGGVTVSVSTGGAAPALAALLRESLDALLPEDLDTWLAEAAARREAWRAAGVDLAARRELLRAALTRSTDADRAASSSGGSGCAVAGTRKGTGEGGPS
jgi:siroheme synthase-like protein